MGISFKFNFTIFQGWQQNLPVISSDLMRNWVNTLGKCVRQRTVRQETTKYKASSERVSDCRPLRRRAWVCTSWKSRITWIFKGWGAPTSSKSSIFKGWGAPYYRGAQETIYSPTHPTSLIILRWRKIDDAIRNMQNSELGFLFAPPRTRSGRLVKTTNKALLWT